MSDDKRSFRQICVYCGANPGNNPAYLEAAIELGQCFAERNIALVYGGASIGVMGAIADSTIENGGRAIGIIPQALEEKEIAHKNLTELHVVSSMHERKALMVKLSDGFIALPGGFGTMDELFEVLTWAQLGIHEKPIGLLNIAAYYDKLLAYMEHTVTEGFVKADHRKMVLSAAEPKSLLDQMAAYKAPLMKKWIEGLEQS